MIGAKLSSRYHPNYLQKRSILVHRITVMYRRIHHAELGRGRVCARREFSPFLPLFGLRSELSSSS